MQEATATVWGFLLPWGPAACVPRGAIVGTANCNRLCMGRHSCREKPPPRLVDFGFLSKITVFPVGRMSAWLGCSVPGCSKATDVPLVADGWVVSSASFLSHFPENRRDLSALGSVKRALSVHRFREVLSSWAACRVVQVEESWVFTAAPWAQRAWWAPDLSLQGWNVWWQR